MKKNNISLLTLFLIIILAVIFGSFITPQTRFIGIHFYPIVNTIGNLFINALSLIVVPLVFSSIVTGINKIGSEKEFGKIASKTIGLFILTNFLAILLGFVLSLLNKPFFVNKIFVLKFFVYLVNL